MNGSRGQLGFVMGLRSVARIWDLGLRVECPSWKYFLRILTSIYTNFNEKHEKQRTTKSQSPTEIKLRTSRLPILKSEQLGHFGGDF